MVKKIHGCGVATDVWGDSLVLERWTTLRSQLDVFCEKTLDRVTAESATPDTGKDRIFDVPVAFP